MADRRMFRDSRTARGRLKYLRARYTYHRSSVLISFAVPGCDDHRQAFYDLMEERMNERIVAAIHRAAT